MGRAGQRAGIHAEGTARSTDAAHHGAGPYAILRHGREGYRARSSQVLMVKCNTALYIDSQAGSLFPMNIDDFFLLNLERSMMAAC